MLETMRHSGVARRNQTKVGLKVCNEVIKERFRRIVKKSDQGGIERRIRRSVT